MGSKQISPFGKNGCVKTNALPLSSEVKNATAQDLWKSVMCSWKNAKGEIVLNTPDTPSCAFGSKIAEFLDDEAHIDKKFSGERPKVQQIYKAALFSKTKWNAVTGGKIADLEKGNVFAVAVALRLDEKQTEELLHSAGFCLNYEHALDVAMMYFIHNEIYDMEKIMAILGEFSNVKNGLDCFVFVPRTEEQKPGYTQKQKRVCKTINVKF